jgi:hypothetical protein
MEALEPREPFRRRDIAGASLRLGVGLADEKRAIADERFHRYPLDENEPVDPLLTLNHAGGGGSEDEYEQRMEAWLWPAPTGDSLRLVYRWEALGISEASIIVDIAELNSAREHVQDIWGD